MPLPFFPHSIAVMLSNRLWEKKEKRRKVGKVVWSGFGLVHSLARSLRFNWMKIEQGRKIENLLWLNELVLFVVVFLLFIFFINLINLEKF